MIKKYIIKVVEKELSKYTDTIAAQLTQMYQENKKQHELALEIESKKFQKYIEACDHEKSTRDTLVKIEKEKLIAMKNLAMPILPISYED